MSEIFIKSVTRSLVIITVFAVITTIAYIFQTHRLDALEKRVEILEGKP